jgi:hypothetical protein
MNIIKTLVAAALLSGVAVSAFAQPHHYHRHHHRHYHHHHMIRR